MNTDEIKQQPDGRITNVENLSNEMFYEIFDYLDFLDVYRAFSNLNVRFEQLITSSSFLVKFLFPYRPQFDTEYYCENIIQPNRHRIISLRNLTSPLIKTLFTNYSGLDQSFSCLKNLASFRVSNDDLSLLLPCLKLLPCLSSLTISIDIFADFDIDLHAIYRVAFALPTLKYLNVDGTSAMLDDSNLFSISEKITSIEHLTVRHSCTTYGLKAILKHTPRLRHLTCASLHYTDETLENEAPLILPDLTFFWIYFCDVPFYDFREFIEKHFSQLQVFRINTFSNKNYIAPDRWKPLILENMPRLHRFHFTYDLNWNVDFVDHHFESLVQHFSSPFWVKRNFWIQLYLTSGRIEYSLHPNRLTGTDREFEEFLKSINTSSDSSIHPGPMQDNSSDQIHAPIHVSIVYQDDPWTASFMNSIGFILSAITITNLDIGLHKMPVSLFLKIIRFFPNLNELRVHELLLDQSSSLSVEDEENLHYFSSHNKVAHVSHTAEAILTPFLVKLCPRMKYIQMYFNSNSNENVKAFVRYILTKSTTHIPDLNLMTIWIYKANDGTVRLLQNMIDSENLLSNYIIKRCGHNVAIKWDLQDEHAEELSYL